MINNFQKNNFKKISFFVILTILFCFTLINFKVYAAVDNQELSFFKNFIKLISELIELFRSNSIKLNNLKAQIVNQGSTSTPNIWLVGTTPVEIVVAWKPVEGVKEYILERSTSKDFNTSVQRFRLPSSVNVFGDTGKSGENDSISNSNRFQTPQYDEIFPLNFNTIYYYRLKVLKNDGSVVLIPGIVSARVDSGAVRGQSGDLWADVVLGQPNFNSYLPFNYADNASQFTTGINFDNQNRAIFIDGRNNRILGFYRLSPENAYSTATPPLIIGQSDIKGNTCNGDSTFSSYPQYPRPTNRTLCFTPPGGISPAETVIFQQTAFDEEGNLYVADRHNNRVLKFNKPFETDNIADEVWGQNDFNSNIPNKGLARVGPDTLSFPNAIGGASVHIDSQGNLWVVDGGEPNLRILRFPKVGNSIQKTADVVIGARGFNGEQAWDADVVLDTENRRHQLLGLFITSDRDGNIYIASRYQNKDVIFKTPRSRAFIIKYPANIFPQPGTSRKAFSLYPDNTSCPGCQIIVDENSISTSTLWDPQPSTHLRLWWLTGLIYDKTRHGLWFSTQYRTYFYDLTSNKVEKLIVSFFHDNGMAVDQKGNFYESYAQNNISVKMYPKDKVDSINIQKKTYLSYWNPDDAYIVYAPGIDSVEEGKAYKRPLDKFIDGASAVVVNEKDNQLIVSDGMRILFWNNFRDPRTGEINLRSGQAASGSWDYAVNRNTSISDLRIKNNKLWVAVRGPLSKKAPNRYSALGDTQCYDRCIYVFDLPLTSDSKILRIINVRNTVMASQNDPQLNRDRGLNYDGEVIKFEVIDEDSIWLATMHGVLRLVNITGARDPRRGPYIDVVLGRSAGTINEDGQLNTDFKRLCNRREPHLYPTMSSSICLATYITFDKEGNLFVLDQDFGMDGSRTRLLMFSSSTLARLPFKPEQTIFGADANISATYVYGTNDNFNLSGNWDNPSPCSVDSGCNPRVAIFDNNDNMIIVQNPYAPSDTAIPLVYVNYKVNRKPLFALATDRIMFPWGGVFDSFGNLYIPSSNWNRVLIFKKPLANLQGIQTGSQTNIQTQTTTLFKITSFSLVDKRTGRELRPVSTSNDGTKIFEVNTSTGFYVVIEGDTGSNNERPLNLRNTNQPGVQIITDKPLGLGGNNISCQSNDGVPATIPFNFSSSQATANISDMSCYIKEGLPFLPLINDFLATSSNFQYILEIDSNLRLNTSTVFKARIVGDKGTITEEKQIIIRYTPFQPNPTISLSANPTQGQAPLSVEFIANLNNFSSDCKNLIWNFGDGTSTNRQLCGSAGNRDVITHTYTNPGTYRAILSIDNIISNPIIVNVTSTATSTQEQPIVTLTSTSTLLQGYVPFTVPFTIRWSNFDNQCHTLYISFGDGNTTRTPICQATGSLSINHTFSRAGSYLVYSAIDQVRSNSLNINVLERQTTSTILLSATLTQGTLPLEVQFTVVLSPSTNTCRSLIFNFGDGQTRTLNACTYVLNVNYRYAAPGIYRAFVSSDNATSNTIIINVNNNQTSTTSIRLSAYPQKGVVPFRTVLLAEFDNLPQTQSCRFITWDFGNGQIKQDYVCLSSSQNKAVTSYTYLQPGNYQVNVSSYNMTSNTVNLEVISLPNTATKTPIINYFGLLNADESIRIPSQILDDGTMVFNVSAPTGFMIYLEGTYRTIDDYNIRPQIIVNQPLGDGGRGLSCKSPYINDGVPATQPLDFNSSSALSNIKDMKCYFGSSGRSYISPLSNIKTAAIVTRNISLNAPQTIFVARLLGVNGSSEKVKMIINYLR